MPVSEQTYEQVALQDPEGQWELVCGRLRRRPGMTFEHSHVIQRLTRRLVQQLDEHDYVVSANHTRLRISTGSYYIPDLCVIPAIVEQQMLREFPGRLEVYDDPIPLVVEVWSPSTGDYDVEEKLREYQRRSDLEIWRLHPYERTLTSWRRGPDGSYNELRFRDGHIGPVALPAVSIDIQDLFPPAL